MNDDAIQKGDIMMDVLEAITSRYACRSYTTDRLTEQETLALIDAANATPAASHDFSVLKLTVVQDSKLLSEIDAATAHGLPPLGDHPTFGAPTLMILSIRPNEMMPVVPYCTASCAAENIMIAARGLGLASVFLMGVPLVLQKKTELLAKLHIEDDFKPVIVVAVGHAKNPLDIVKPKRLNVERL